MALELPYGIKLTNPKANIDEYYGPYNSLQAAYEGVPAPVREIGKTVGIKDPSTGHITEYWWQEGIENSNLVKKEQTELAPVATSGDYNDLENTPTKLSDFINDGNGGSPLAPFVTADEVAQSDWNVNSSSSPSFILNKPAITAGSGTKSLMIGNAMLSIGQYSIASGSDTIANAYCAIAEGDSTRASGACSHTEGSGTIAKGSNAHAEGNYTIASGANSHVFGMYNIEDVIQTWQANRSYTVGEMVRYNSVTYKCKTANQDPTFDYSKWVSAGTNLKYVEIVGNGTGISARSNARTLDWSGNETLAGTSTAQDFIILDSPNTSLLGVVSTINNLATVATSGEYTDLEGIPSLADVATTGDYDDLENTPTKLSDFINDGNGDSPLNPFITESDIEEIQEVMSPLASTQNKLISQSEAQDLVNTLSLSPIMADSTGQKSFDFESQMYSTLVQGSTNLETGPWYKNEGNGFQPCNSTTGVYVSLNDSAVVINDESLFFYFMHGYRYQRVKVGVQGVYGKIKTPYGEEVDLNYTDGSTLSGKFANVPCIYFYDDHNLFGHTGRVIYVCQASNLVSKTNAAEEYLVAAGETINDIAVGTDPDNTSDLVYPTTKYVCTQAQTASTAPVWAYRVIISESSNLADVAFTGNYTDLQNKPLNSISITYTPGGQGGEPEYNTTTITLDGTVHNIQVPTVVRTVNPSNKNAVASSAVAVALASKLDSSTFQEFQQEVILAGGKIEDPQGELIIPISIHSTVNVYANKITSGSTAYKIVHGAGISDTYFVVYDVTNYQGRSIYFSQSAATRLRMCQTNAVSASDFKDLIDAQTDVLDSNRDVITYNNCLWIYDNETPTTLSNMEIPIQSGATTLIIYVGNAEASTEMSTTGLKNAFLDDIISFNDPDPTEAAKATNAVQSGTLYTKFSQIYTALAGMPTRTSDLINDGEGDSPSNPFLKSSDMEASQSDWNYIMGN